jgi:hypothetical protein
VTFGNFGAGLPEGLLVVREDDNPGAAQNFRLTSWSAVRSKIAPGQ